MAALTDSEREEIEAVLARVRDEMLTEMRTVGFDLKGERRYDASAWDINNGPCQEFAKMALEAMPERLRAHAVGRWVEELGAPNHYVIYAGGRWYDAECIGGIEDVWQLPFYLGSERPQAAIGISLV